MNNIFEVKEQRLVSVKNEKPSKANEKPSKAIACLRERVDQ